jgi:hypothetical protein
MLDALPRDPRQEVRWLTSGAAPLIVYGFRRVRRRTSTDAFQTCDAGRAGVQLPSEAGTPDLTIGCAAADRAGARPSYGGCQAWIGVFGDYLIGFMPWVTGHQSDIETEFNRVIDMVISSAQSFDVSS